MKNPIQKLYDTWTTWYTGLTYRIWDNKFEIWDVGFPKFVAFPYWLVISILHVFVVAILRFLLLFVSSKDEEGEDF